MEKQVRMFPFDALELPDGSFDREYSAGDFRDYFKKFIGNGVWNGIGKQLQVVHKSSLIVSVLSGACFIEGAGYTQEIETEIPLATANSSYGRYDLICAKLSYTDRNIKLYAKAGVPSASPKKPTLQRDSDAFELCLAEIYVGAGVTSISQANITDTRMNSEVCGWVSAMFETLDTTDLYLQYETYWKMIEKQINSNMAQFSSGYNLYGVAGGTGTYTANISGFVLSEGINVKIKFTNAHDGQHTLNINGLGAKPIVRADGTSFPIKANTIYNLIYDGVNFTLGGEGGWGNAQPSDVLPNKSFTNDNGFQVGSMPSNGNANQSIQNGVLKKGYTDGGKISNLTAENVKSGVNIGGIVGNVIEPLKPTTTVYIGDITGNNKINKTYGGKINCIFLKGEKSNIETIPLIIFVDNKLYINSPWDNSDSVGSNNPEQIQNIYNFTATIYSKKPNRGKLNIALSADLKNITITGIDVFLNYQVYVLHE